MESIVVDLGRGWDAAVGVWEGGEEEGYEDEGDVS